MHAGFMKKEKALPPISAAALEEKFAAAQKEAKRLRSVIDPEETPYESRYEERALLTALAKQAAANEEAEPVGSDARRRARIIRALADSQIGRNFMDTEEPGSAQSRLESAIEGLDGVETEAVAHLEALNNLGVVWCNRGEFSKALELLERARTAHAAVEASSPPSSSSDDEAFRVRLADANTLTTYYLAQVYGNLGRRAEAASHCHETMRRQLLRRSVSDAADAAAREAAEAVGGAGGELAFGSETRSEFAFDAQEGRATRATRASTTRPSRASTSPAPPAAERVRRRAQRRGEKAEGGEGEGRRRRRRRCGFRRGGGGGGARGGGGVGRRRGGADAPLPNATAADKKAAEEQAAAKAAAAKAAGEEASGGGGGGMTEDEAEQVALVDLAWARMWLAALKRAATLRLRDAGNDDDDDAAAKESEAEGAALGPLSGLCFTPLQVPKLSGLLAELGQRVRDSTARASSLGWLRAARAKATCPRWFRHDAL